MTTTYILCMNSSDDCMPLCASNNKDVLNDLIQKTQAFDEQDKIKMAMLKDADDSKLLAYMDEMVENHPLRGYLDLDNWINYITDDNPNKLFIKSIQTL